MALRPRTLAAGLAGLAYVVAAQWLMTRSVPSAWSAVVLLVPMLALAAAGAWRSGRRFWSAAAAVLGIVLVVQAAIGGSIPSERLWLLQHVGTHLVLAAVFGLTLAPGARPLIARLAARVHPRGLTLPMEHYTRKVTVAWTAYFVVMALVSLLLYLYAPFATWATFANLLTPLALVLMFAGEFVLRYRLHPEFERVSMRDAIRAYGQPAGPAASAGPAATPMPTSAPGAVPTAAAPLAGRQASAPLSPPAPCPSGPMHRPDRP